MGEIGRVLFLGEFYERENLNILDYLFYYEFNTSIKKRACRNYAFV
jgi:hypothetical protein